jgi:hypothetical protein
VAVYRGEDLVGIFTGYPRGKFKFTEADLQGVLVRIESSLAELTNVHPTKTGGLRVKKAPWEPFVRLYVALSKRSAPDLAPRLREDYEKYRPHRGKKKWPDLPTTDGALAAGIRRIRKELESDK